MTSDGLRVARAAIYRTLRQLHSPAQIEAACKAALAAERFTTGFVPVPRRPASGTPEEVLPEHEHIRGSSYYRSDEEDGSSEQPDRRNPLFAEARGMAAYQEHAESPDFAKLGFDDRLVMLLDERQQRNDRSYLAPAQGATASGPISRDHCEAGTASRSSVRPAEKRSLFGYGSFVAGGTNYMHAPALPSGDQNFFAWHTRSVRLPGTLAKAPHGSSYGHHPSRRKLLKPPPIDDPRPTH